AWHPGPHHPKLSFFAVHLHFEYFSRTHLAAHAVNHGPCAAEVFDTGQLHKGQVVGVHAPNSYRQMRSNPRTATTIHSVLLRTPRMVWRSHTEENLPGSHLSGASGHVANWLYHIELDARGGKSTF